MQVQPAASSVSQSVSWLRPEAKFELLPAESDLSNSRLFPKRARTGSLVSPRRRRTGMPYLLCLFGRAAELPSTGLSLDAQATQSGLETLGAAVWFMAAVWFRLVHQVFQTCSPYVFNIKDRTDPRAHCP